jgi:hypothetical protein
MTFPTWNEARDHAEAKVRRLGIAHGIEKPTRFEKGWRVFMLPRPENRQGHELRCEALEPEHYPRKA